MIFNFPKLTTKPFFRRSIQIILTIILVFFAYSNTYHSPFVFDDAKNITENEYIRINELTPANLWEAATKSPCRHRPVANATLALNYFFHQYDLFGYHFINIFIHALNGILLFFIFFTTLNIYQRNNSNETLDTATIEIAAFSASLLWVLNPIQTQAVTYIIQRMTSLATLFYLLSLLMYIRARLNTDRLKSSAFFSLCIFFGIISFATKEIAVTLPFAILLYEFFFFQNLKPIYTKKKGFIIFISAGIVVFLILFFLNFKPIDRILLDYTWRDFTLKQRLLTEARVVVFYLSLLLYPNPSRLNFEHDFQLSDSLFNPISTFFSISLILLLLILSLYGAKKYRLASFAILSFFLNLLIESSVIGLEIIFEHRAYLPSVFLFLPISLFVIRVTQKKFRSISALILVIGISFLWTYGRNNTWESPEKLWADCVSKSPKKVRPLHAYGYALMTNGQYSESIRILEKVLEIKPNHTASHINLGEIYIKKGDYLRGIKHFTKAVTLEPKNARSFAFLGMAYELNGEAENAEANYCRALEINPDYSGVYSKLGSLWQSEEKWDRAFSFFSAAAESNPHNAELFYRLGIAYEHMKQPDKAIRQYEKAINLNTEHGGSHFNIGKIFFTRNQQHKAIVHLKEACRIDPKSEAANANLGNILFAMGNFSEAMKYLEKTAVMNPDSFDANVKAGLAFLKSYRLSDALHFLKISDRIYPENALIKNNIGSIYFKLNKIDNAILYYKDSLIIDPSQRHNHQVLGELYKRKGNETLSAYHYSKLQ